MNQAKYEFLHSIKEGTLIRMNGSLRLCRRIEWMERKAKRGMAKKYMHQKKGYFYFTILRCSWTGRAYTIYTSNDMAQADIEIVSHNFKSKMTAFDKAFLAELDSSRTYPCRRNMNCCTVHGIR